MSAVSRRAVLRATVATSALVMVPSVTAMASPGSDPALELPRLVRAANRVVRETGDALIAAGLPGPGCLPPEDHPCRPAYDVAQETFDEACAAHLDLWSEIAEAKPSSIRGAAAKAEAAMLLLRNWHGADETGDFDVDVMDEPARLAWSLAEDIERLAGKTA